MLYGRWCSTRTRHSCCHREVSDTGINRSGFLAETVQIRPPLFYSYRYPSPALSLEIQATDAQILLVTPTPKILPVNHDTDDIRHLSYPSSVGQEVSLTSPSLSTSATPLPSVCTYSNCPRPLPVCAEVRAKALQHVCRAPDARYSADCVKPSPSSRTHHQLCPSGPLGLSSRLGLLLLALAPSAASSRCTTSSPTSTSAPAIETRWRRDGVERLRLGRAATLGLSSQRATSSTGRPAAATPAEAVLESSTAAPVVLLGRLVR